MGITTSEMLSGRAPKKTVNACDLCGEPSVVLEGGRERMMCPRCADAFYAERDARAIEVEERVEAAKAAQSKQRQAAKQEA